MIGLANIKSSPPINWSNENNLYIGRKNTWNNLEESKWHNPFVMNKESERKGVLRQYLEYIVDSPLIDDLHELDNKTLFCWCCPKKCHGHILSLLRQFQLIDELGEWTTLYDWIDSDG